MKKFDNTSLKNLILLNTIVMLIYMMLNSTICGDGLSGGECIKHKDNLLFFIQLVINLILLVANVQKNGRKNLPKFLKLFAILIFIYIILATIHSISKAGFF
jgi:hypothetical protein